MLLITKLKFSLIDFITFKPNTRIMRLLKGSAHFLVALFVLSLIALFLFTPLKRNIYSTYQNLGFKAGFNFNNIASLNYVNFIKSQNGDYQNTKQAVFLNKSIDYQNTNLAENIQSVLGDSSSSNKWIDINLS